jgi:hypothetical protein
MTTENTTPRDPSEDPLRNLAGQVDNYRRQAENLQHLLNGRGLLECPGCGLHEDELADMTVLVATRDRPGEDTGLRFEAMDDAGATWWCPSCGTPFSTAPMDRGA